MGTPIIQVDAFTDKPFAGNPAAVCLLDGTRDDAWMQNVAREMNLSETAFVLKTARGWLLRWFTPKTEVDLCGHATLATAHVLVDRGEKNLTFKTRSGDLHASLRGEWLVLDFPSLPVEPAPPPPGLLEALGVEATFTGKSRFDRVVEVESEDALLAIAPDFAALARADTRGTVVTCAGTKYDFVSRCFYPAVGIDEDPVTGSAHCALAPFWGKRLGKRELTAFQASSRGGLVRLRLEKDRVLLGGRAVTVFEGQLSV